jgi:hypothetical protein
MNSSVSLTTVEDSEICSCEILDSDPAAEVHPRRSSPFNVYRAVRAGSLRGTSTIEFGLPPLLIPFHLALNEVIFNAKMAFRRFAIKLVEHVLKSTVVLFVGILERWVGLLKAEIFPVSDRFVKAEN